MLRETRISAKGFHFSRADRSEGYRLQPLHEIQEESARLQPLRLIYLTIELIFGSQGGLRYDEEVVPRSSS